MGKKTVKDAVKETESNKKIIFVGGIQKTSYYDALLNGSKNFLAFDNIQDAEIKILLNPLDVKMVISEVIFGEMQLDAYTGKSAGIIFYKKIKKDFPKIPVILITNSFDEMVIPLEEFQMVVESNRDFFFEGEDNIHSSVKGVIKDLIN